MKTLKQLREKAPEGYQPEKKDGKRFVAKHAVKKTADANGNDDKLFKASNLDMVDRPSDDHGYNPGQDEQVYESTELKEKTLTKPELKKREEVAKAIERENPGMAKSKKMAIATSTAKRVAEEVDEQLTEEENQVVDFINNFYDQLDEENKKIFEELAEEQDIEEILSMIQEVLNGEQDG